MKRIFLLLIVLLPLVSVHAEEEPAITFRTEYLAYKGHITVYWQDPYNAPPYALTYEYAEETLDRQPVFYEKIAEGQSCTLDYLAPGGTYILTVTNALGDTGETVISLPAPAPYEDGKLKARHFSLNALPYRQKADQPEARDTRKRIVFHADEMTESINQYDYGVRIELSFPELARDRECEAQVVLAAPGGFIRTYSLGTVTLPHFKADSVKLYWDFVGKEFFSDLYSLNQTISVGSYTVSYYLDGMLAAETQFHIN